MPPTQLRKHYPRPLACRRFAGPGNSGDIPSLHHSGDLGRMARGGSGVGNSLLMSAFDWVQRPNVRQRMKHDRGVPSHRLCPALGGRPDRIALRRCHNRPVARRAALLLSVENNASG